MVRIYDMVTYGVCEPDQGAPTQGFTAPSAAAMAAPALELQLLQVAPTAPRQEPHPSLRYTDVDDFLTSVSD